MTLRRVAPGCNDRPGRRRLNTPPPSAHASQRPGPVRGTAPDGASSPEVELGATSPCRRRHARRPDARERLRRSAVADRSPRPGLRPGHRAVAPHRRSAGRPAHARADRRARLRRPPVAPSVPTTCVNWCSPSSSRRGWCRADGQCASGAGRHRSLLQLNMRVRALEGRTHRPAGARAELAVLAAGAGRSGWPWRSRWKSGCTSSTVWRPVSTMRSMRPDSCCSVRGDHCSRPPSTSSATPRRCATAAVCRVGMGAGLYIVYPAFYHRTSRTTTASAGGDACGPTWAASTSTCSLRSGVLGRLHVHRQGSPAAHRLAAQPGDDCAS